MRVLLSAFAARAGSGSEPGFGWAWARSLAEAGHDVTVLTQAKHAAANEAWLTGRDVGHLRFDYLPDARPHGRPPRQSPVSSAMRLAGYLAWQRTALARAREMHAERPFDVVHHVTYSSIVPGTPMWRIGIPLVFGPVGSGQTAPAGARPIFGWDWPSERVRGLAIAATRLRLNPAASRAATHAAVVLAVNDDTAELARRIGAVRVEEMCDTGVETGRVRRDGRSPPEGGPFRVAWVGKLVPRKGIRLGIDAIAHASCAVDIELHIAGDGPQAGDVRTWVEDRGLAGRVHLHGRLPWAEVQRLLADSDVMLFTSVRESFGSQLVEAAAAGLPIVAIDLHGVSSIVPPAAAVKVPLTDLASTARGLADALVRVLTDDRTYVSMSAAATQFALSESWPARAERMSRVYESVTSTVT